MPQGPRRTTPLPTLRAKARPDRAERTAPRHGPRSSPSQGVSHQSPIASPPHTPRRTDRAAPREKAQTPKISLKPARRTTSPHVWKRHRTHPPATRLPRTRNRQLPSVRHRAHTAGRDLVALDVRTPSNASVPHPSRSRTSADDATASRERMLPAPVRTHAQILLPHSPCCSYPLLPQSASSRQ